MDVQLYEDTCVSEEGKANDLEDLEAFEVARLKWVVYPHRPTVKYQVKAPWEVERQALLVVEALDVIRQMNRIKPFIYSHLAFVSAFYWLFEVVQLLNHDLHRPPVHRIL